MVEFTFGFSQLSGKLGVILSGLDYATVFI
jgi:hypothetical protein